MVKEETSKHPHSKCRSKIFFLSLFFVPHQNGLRFIPNMSFCGDVGVYILYTSIFLPGRVFVFIYSCNK